ncbi:MAG: sigma-70 family RNA polymerase sigma factor [Actinomycetia bacterium]|nr:sigma-70 family RNA polymerase sigma factor [Actinomycetes bacterium]
MAPDPSELDHLVDGIRERSEKAFSDLHRAVANGLMAHAFGMLRDRQAAEDAVQQAFLELAKTAPSFRGDGRALRSWLYRAVRFNCLDEVRRRKRRPEVPTETLPEYEAHGTGIDMNLDPDLEDALRELTELQRNIIILKHVLEFTGDEIADILNTNRAAVYASAARAERKLKKLLGRVRSHDHAASVWVEGRL